MFTSSEVHFTRNAQQSGFSWASWIQFLSDKAQNTTSVAFLKHERIPEKTVSKHEQVQVSSVTFCN